MKLTNGEIYALYMGTEALSQKELPISASFKISRTMKEIAPIVIQFEETRNNIFEAHGKMNKENIFVPHDKENAKEADTKLKELINTEIEVNVQIFKIEELGQDIKVNPKVLNMIDKLLEQ